MNDEELKKPQPQEDDSASVSDEMKKRAIKEMENAVKMKKELRDALMKLRESTNE